MHNISKEHQSIDIEPGRRREVFVIEDDRVLRRAIVLALEDAGFSIICFATGDALLSVTRSRVPACILLDDRIPGKSGLEVLGLLRARELPCPIVMMSGLGSVSRAVAAMKAGAADFLDKPFGAADLVQRVARVIEKEQERREQVARAGGHPLPPLTARQVQVLRLTGAGNTSKEIARSLKISARTVEFHRSQLMKKLGAKNVVELARLAATNPPAA